MAHSKTYWEGIIDSKISSIGLSSSSVAEWKLWRDTIVSIVMLLEAIFDTFKSDTTEYIDQNIYGTLPWYKKMCRDFQLGDTLVVTEGVVGYPVIDTTKQIVKAVSVRAAVSGLIVKVAKLNNGSLAPLSATELTSFSSYFNQRKIIGTMSQVYSIDGDEIFYDIVVNYDPLYDPTTVKTDIENTLESYRDNYPFDAVFYRNDFVQQIMNVPGVVNVLIEDLEINYGTGGAAIVNNSVELAAGYYDYHSSSQILMQI